MFLLRFMEEICTIIHISMERVQIDLSDEFTIFSHYANYMVINSWIINEQTSKYMREDSIHNRRFPLYTHRIAPIPSPTCILSGLHLQDTWLGREGSRARNWDKTLPLLFFRSSFIHPSLSSHIRIPSAWGLIY